MNLPPRSIEKAKRFFGEELSATQLKSPSSESTISIAESEDFLIKDKESFVPLRPQKSELRRQSFDAVLAPKDLIYTAANHRSRDKVVQFFGERDIVISDGSQKKLGSFYGVKTAKTLTKSRSAESLSSKGSSELLEDYSNARLSLLLKETMPDTAVATVALTGLPALLGSKLPLFYFLCFLLQEHTFENLFFLLEYKENKGKTEKNEQLFKKFVVPEAPFELNLTYKSKKQIESNLINSDCYDKAAAEIMVLLEQSFNGFKKSSVYSQMVNDLGDFTISRTKEDLDKVTNLLNSLLVSLHGSESKRDVMIVQNVQMYVDLCQALEQRKNFSGDGSKKMSEIWKNMTQEEKMPYVLKAKEERIKYKKDLEAYNQQRERERNNLLTSTNSFGYPVIAPLPQNPGDTTHIYLDPSMNNNPNAMKFGRQSVGNLVSRKEKLPKDKSGFTWVHKTKDDFEESSSQSNTNSEDSISFLPSSHGSITSKKPNLNITDSVNTLGASLPDVGIQSLYLDADQIREMLSHTHVNTDGQNLNRTFSQLKISANELIGSSKSSSSPKKLQCPVRPLNEYLIFNRENRKNYGTNNSQKMAEIWREMSFEEKKPYVLMAKQERLKYKREMEEYKRYLEREKHQTSQPPVTLLEKLPLLAPRQKKSIIPDQNIILNTDDIASFADAESTTNLDDRFIFETDKNQYLLKSHLPDKYSMSAVINKWKFVHQSSSDFEEDSSNQEEKLTTPSYNSPKLSGNNSPKYSGHNSPMLLPNSGSNSPKLPPYSPRIVTSLAQAPYISSTTHSGSNSPKQSYYSSKITGSSPFVSSNLSNDEFLNTLSPMAYLSLSKNSIDSSVTTRQNSIAEYGRFSSANNIGVKSTGMSPVASNTGIDQTQLRRTSSVRGPNVTTGSNQNLLSVAKPQRRLKKSGKLGIILVTSESPIYEDVRVDFPVSENNLVANSNDGLLKPGEIKIPSQETVREESSPRRSSIYDLIPEVDYTPVDNSFRESDE
ncbi:hypothetical protein HDV06_000041 [Boothiomyces sp. JEL0866]|nr:hypothetical protein HDV06_000041 [Boothiomyces sp. JEL0866]